MEFQPTPSDPLGRLLCELVDGDPSPEMLEELAGLLRDDPQARLDYIRWMSLHADLRRRTSIATARGPEASPAEVASISHCCSPRDLNRRLSPPRHGFHAAGTGSPKEKTRFNIALALTCSLLFAAAVAGTGAIISGLFPQLRPADDQHEVVRAPAVPSPPPVASPCPWLPRRPWLPRAPCAAGPNRRLRVVGRARCPEARR